MTHFANRHIRIYPANLEQWTRCFGFDHAMNSIARFGGVWTNLVTGLSHHVHRSVPTCFATIWFWVCLGLYVFSFFFEQVIYIYMYIYVHTPLSRERFLDSQCLMIKSIQCCVNSACILCAVLLKCPLTLARNP